MDFIRRFWIYQKERFPVFVHIPLIAVFSFSAIAFSRVCRGLDSFIPWSHYIVGLFISMTLFFLLRILDEFKDAEDDKQYRPHLPVPRGLVTLRELGSCGLIIVLFQVGIQLWFFPKMLILYAGILLWLFLMTMEFFIADWLRKHQFWYVTSHMCIIPFIDIYESGLDWHLDGTMPPAGLIWFFGVSFFNGIVLEIGRKIKAPDKEEHNSYSRSFGIKKSVFLWLGMLFLTCVVACGAALFAGFGLLADLGFIALAILCAIPGWLMVQKPSIKNSKAVEISSVIWTFTMYLGLGAIPFLF